MVSMGTILTGLNILIAVGVIGATIVSWLRGGFIEKTVTVFDQVDSIENKVDDIHDWKDDVEDILIAVSVADGSEAKELDESEVKEKLGMEKGYVEVLKELNGENEYTDGGKNKKKDD